MSEPPVADKASRSAGENPTTSASTSTPRRSEARPVARPSRSPLPRPVHQLEDWRRSSCRPTQAGWPSSSFWSTSAVRSGQPADRRLVDHDLFESRSSTPRSNRLKLPSSPARSTPTSAVAVRAGKLLPPDARSFRRRHPRRQTLHSIMTMAGPIYGQPIRAMPCAHGRAAVRGSRSDQEDDQAVAYTQSAHTRRCSPMYVGASWRTATLLVEHIAPTQRLGGRARRRSSRGGAKMQPFGAPRRMAIPHLSRSLVGAAQFLSEQLARAGAGLQRHRA